MRTSETVATRLLPAARIVLGSTRPRRADSAAVARLVPACCCSVKFSIVVPEQLQWLTRPHEPGEPARHVAELQPSVGFRDSRANVWRYEPGARGKRHVHDEQEETFVVLAGRRRCFSAIRQSATRLPWAASSTFEPELRCRPSTMARRTSSYMHIGLLPTTALRCSPPPCRRWRRHLTRRCSAAKAATSHAHGTSLLGAECGHEMRADRVTLIGKHESRLGPARGWSTRPAFVAARASPRRSPSALLRAASRALGDQPNVRRRSLIRTMRCSASVGDRVNPRRS